MVADPGIISEADVTCADSAKAAAWVMNGAKLFSDSAVDSSIKQDKVCLSKIGLLLNN